MAVYIKGEPVLSKGAAQKANNGDVYNLGYFPTDIKYSVGIKESKEVYEKASNLGCSSKEESKEAVL